MSKIFISIKKRDANADFDFRFGRTAYFCFYNSENDEYVLEENPYKEKPEGAGEALCEYLLSKGVTKVISGDFGVKSYAIFMRYNIQMIVPHEIKKLEEILHLIKSKS
jgi:predicted Fe-Mo cluster-binding NifX family protein